MSRPGPIDAPVVASVTRPHGAPIAEVTRRDVATGREVLESSHVGHLAVLGPDGELAGSLGEPDRVTFVRSAVKAFQATACLEILDEHGGTAALTDTDIAVGQASHRGENVQLDAVRGLLSRSGTPAEELTTPPAESEARRELGEARLHHNCSGKHALFALAGAALGCHGAELLDPAGALQRRILEVLEEVLGPAAAVGTDGCGAPAVAVPLVRLATAFHRLRSDDRWARARRAALARPELIGGQGRLDSRLLAAGVSAKVGAEGIYGLSWTDADGGVWSLALKCEDGAGRGADAAVVGLLGSAGVVAPEVYAVAPPLGGGAPAGEVRATSEVLALGSGLTR